MAGKEVSLFASSLVGKDEQIAITNTLQHGQYDNISLDMKQMTEILRSFYEEFSGESNYLLIALYVPVIVLAMTANILVIMVVFKYHYMRSVTNYFVVNLSIADLLVTVICMPMAVSQAVSIIWVYGELMCKLFFYLQGVAVAASVFTITAMSIDRYLAIRSPIAFRRIFNRRSMMMVIIAIWLIALSIFAPVLKASPITDLNNITFMDQWGSEEGLLMPRPPTFYVCSEDFKPLGIDAHTFGAICFVLVYAVPGFIVIVSYSMMGRTLCARKPPFDCDSIEGSASSQQGFKLVRERRRVAWILLLLAVLFALCWLPYNVLRLLIDLGIIREGRMISDVLSYCLFLGHANSALNPVVYCVMTRNFRRSVAEILCRGTYDSKQHRLHNKTAGSGAGVFTGCRGITGVAADRYATKAHLSSNRKGNLGNVKLVKHSVGLTTQQNCRTDIAAVSTYAILNQTKNASSSSGYDSYHDRHSPHRRCFMIKNSKPESQSEQHQKPIFPTSDPSMDDARDCIVSDKEGLYHDCIQISWSSSGSLPSRMNQNNKWNAIL